MWLASGMRDLVRLERAGCGVIAGDQLGGKVGARFLYKIVHRRSALMT